MASYGPTPCTGEAAVEYQVLAADSHIATASLFAAGLANATLLQLARIATGTIQAFSAYAVYRQGSMSFVASGQAAKASLLASELNHTVLL